MDQNAIFKSLHALEDSLRSVSSAVKMVEKTTQAYDELRMLTEKYCDELPAITSQLKKLTEQMNSGWEDVLSEMDNRGKAILDDVAYNSKKLLSQTEQNNSSFRQTTDATARSFRTQLLDEQRIFSEQIRLLESVGEEIKKANENLYPRISAIHDKLVIDMKNICQDINTHINEIEDGIKKQDNILSNISSKIRSVNAWNFIIFISVIASNAFVYYLLKMDSL